MLIKVKTQKMFIKGKTILYTIYDLIVGKNFQLLFIIFIPFHFLEAKASKGMYQDL